MKTNIIKILTKTITCVALVAVVSTPALAGQYETSSVNTVTTNKNTWVTSMQNAKVTRLQETSVILHSGIGHANAVNNVKIGSYVNGEWKRVMGSADGVQMIKNDAMTTFYLNRTVNPGELMRIRIKLGSVSANSGFSTDTVCNVWYWN